ncbi:DNA-binding transcriptional LysR family regulator [Rhodoblastus acidophilus]|uniref:LysR family transcriptional regulator n=1 Tax=Rhodoblastus acidophilus TaxID=1074 RepID=UPI0022242E80|nr:LysR family transcriptional regulator [Rhodoblastus acidophilus]MCW2285398.1 DNA-binding transcriptional LysR family regulator [Rhodoblastus acidophilus]MCW2334353.1 DNA-binding transcriptional LysR family regulator [Rhodoblastus acidophilus]
MYEKLEYLLALAKEKHFGHAAEACGVSQPNFSLTIKQLETTLGVTLVDRGARFLGFTPEGQRVLEWSRRIVADTRAMIAEVEVMKNGLSGQLRLAAIPTALPLVLRFTTSFSARYPGTRFHIASHTSNEILAMLDNLDADVGFSYLDSEPIGKAMEVPLYRERHHLVTAAGNPLSDRATVTWEEVAGLELCLLSPDMQNRRIIDRIFAEVDCKVDPVLETGSIVVVVSHVRAGHCATIMPNLMAEELALPANVKKIPIVAPEVSSLVGLVAPRRDPQPPLTAAFIAHARAVAAELDAIA